VIRLEGFQPLRQGVACLPQVDLEIRPGEILVLMGRSGVGKTTLLESIRGDLAHQGRIIGKPILHSVYQGDNQLFPWMTVKQNFLLAKVNEAWTTVAERWKLTPLIDRRPDEISGGQRQRFVLLRSIYRGAELLLCDEPLNHLDSFTAMTIADDFRRLVREQNLGVLWITHNIDEAALLSDHCCMLTPDSLIKLRPEQITYDHVKQYLSD
jgi:ABC-type nitrate/sulfonate/bicarbonate transport system ATPase subunit